MPRAKVSAGFFTSRMTSATISRPVNAIMASGIEKASAFQLGTAPKSRVRVSSWGWNATASPSTASSSCTPMSTAATTIEARYRPGRRISRPPAISDCETHRDQLVGRMRERTRIPHHRERVVRDEEQREGDHDGEVEHHRPADDEAGQVAERVSCDRSGPARLVDRAHALLVGGGREPEEQAGPEQHERRQPERPQRDDAEREVERARDLAVDDREDRLGAEDPLQSGELACH